MSRRSSQRGVQQGAQLHAEGEHGAKTREFIRSHQIRTPVEDGPNGTPSGPRHDEQEIARHDDIGKDRLYDDREQHDPAEKNSEQTRLLRDMDRHGHESAADLLRRNRQNRARGM